MVSQCTEIKRVEQGMAFDPQLLLAPDSSPKGKDGLSLWAQSLAAFEASLAKRKPLMEHSILNRLNCHIEKFDQLFKSIDHSFVDKNRYKDMLPFRFNRVILNKEFVQFEFESHLKPMSGSFFESELR